MGKFKRHMFGGVVGHRKEVIDQVRGKLLAQFEC